MAAGFQAAAHAVDAGDLASIVNLIDEVEAEFGLIDVLHFHSAALHDGTIDKQEANAVVADLTVNIGAAVVGVQKVSASMLERGSGSIPVTGGMFAITPNPDYLSLGIGKAGVRNLTQALFERFKDDGVHIALVNVATKVAPGSVESQGVAEAFWTLRSAPTDQWTCKVPIQTDTFDTFEDNL